MLRLHTLSRSSHSTRTESSHNVQPIDSHFQSLHKFMQRHILTKYCKCFKWLVFVICVLQISFFYFIYYQGIYVLNVYMKYTVRLLTHVHCKPTHFFFHSFIATMSYSLQTSFTSVMKDWADIYHEWGTPTRSPSRSNAIIQTRVFSH